MLIPLIELRISILYLKLKISLFQRDICILIRDISTASTNICIPIIVFFYYLDEIQISKFIKKYLYLKCRHLLYKGKMSNGSTKKQEEPSRLFSELLFLLF